MSKHLWEYEHPYYCAEDGYYYNADQATGWGKPERYGTFSDFLQEWGGADLDMNLLFRWDWERLTPEQYEAYYGVDGGIPEQRQNKDGYSSVLTVFMMMQRKGCKKVLTVTHMEDSDEGAVLAYLKPAWEHLRVLWGGVSGVE